MDVHDCSLISRSEPLLPNSVVTVEPGIYIRPEWKNDIHEEFLGIGLRVEDDLVVGREYSKPAENLTSEFHLFTDFIEKESGGKILRE